MDGIIQGLCEQPLSLSIICSWFIQVITGINIPFLLRLKNIPLYRYITFPLTICLLIDIWIIYLLAITDNAKHLCVSFCVDMSFHFSWYLPRSGIIESYGNWMFNTLGNHQTVFQGGWAILCFHEQCVRCLFLHILINPCHYLTFFILAILVSRKWYSIVVLICISLMSSDVVHICMCLLAICISSFLNIYSDSLLIF